MNEYRAEKIYELQDQLKRIKVLKDLGHYENNVFIISDKRQSSLLDCFIFKGSKKLPGVKLLRNNSLEISNETFNKIINICLESVYE